MPIASEQSVERTGRRGKRWPLYLALGVLAVLVLLLIVPAVYPLRLQLLGGYIFLARVYRVPPGAPLSPLFSTHQRPRPRGKVTVSDHGHRYEWLGPLHRWNLRVGNWSYSALWFKGKPVR